MIPFLASAQWPKTSFLANLAWEASEDDRLMTALPKYFLHIRQGGDGVVLLVPYPPKILDGTILHKKIEDSAEVAS